METRFQQSGAIQGSHLSFLDFKEVKLMETFSTSMRSQLTNSAFLRLQRSQINGNDIWLGYQPAKQTYTFLDFKEVKLMET